MAGPAGIMRELHRLRRHAKDLQDQLERGPRLLKAHQAKAAAAEKALLDAKDGLKKLKVSISEKEGSLKSTQAQAAKYAKQLNEAANKKEMDALQSEIATAKKACQELEDAILEAMAAVDDQTAAIPKFEQGAKDAKAAVANFDKENAERMVRLKEQLKKAEAELAAVEKQLDAAEPDVRAVYERGVKANGADALSAVKDKTCVACYTSITDQQYHNLKMENFFVCRNCGRILYLAEEDRRAAAVGSE